MEARTEILSWDTLAIIEGEIECRRESGEIDEGMDDNELFHEICQDDDVFAWAWDDLCLALTDCMEQRNPHGWWHAEVAGFGWRRLDGHAVFQAHDGQALLCRVLPDADCTFRVYDHAGGRGFAVNNHHHDSGPGGEWYYVEPLENVTCPQCGREFVEECEAGEREHIGTFEVCSMCYEYECLACGQIFVDCDEERAFMSENDGVCSSCCHQRETLEALIASRFPAARPESERRHWDALATTLRALYPGVAVDTKPYGLIVRQGSTLVAFSDEILAIRQGETQRPTLTRLGGEHERRKTLTTALKALYPDAAVASTPHSLIMRQGSTLVAFADRILAVRI